MTILTCDDFCQEISHIFYGDTSYLGPLYPIHTFNVTKTIQSFGVRHFCASSKSFLQRRAQVTYAKEGSVAADRGLSPENIVLNKKAFVEAKAENSRPATAVSPVGSPASPHSLLENKEMTDSKVLPEVSRITPKKTEYEDAILAIRALYPSGPFFPAPTCCNTIGCSICTPLYAVGACGDVLCIESFSIIAGSVNQGNCCFSVENKNSNCAIFWKGCTGGLCLCVGAAAMGVSIAGSAIRYNLTKADPLPPRKVIQVAATVGSSRSRPLSAAAARPKTAGPTLPSIAEKYRATPDGGARPQTAGVKPLDREVSVNSFREDAPPSTPFARDEKSQTQPKSNRLLLPPISPGAHTGHSTTAQVVNTLVIVYDEVQRPETPTSTVKVVKPKELAAAPRMNTHHRAASMNFARGSTIDMFRSATVELVQEDNVSATSKPTMPEMSRYN